MKTFALASMIAAGCQPARTDEPTPPATPTPIAETPAAAAQPWCATTIEPFDGGEASLADLLLRTQLVATAKPSLAEADCSGIGKRHLAFSLGSSQSGEAIEVHRALPLYSLGTEHTDYFLVGATKTQPRPVDLTSVCVQYQATVSARLDWLLPLKDADEVAAWNERLARGTCGRPGN